MFTPRDLEQLIKQQVLELSQSTLTLKLDLMLVEMLSSQSPSSTNRTIVLPKSITQDHALYQLIQDTH